jgi:hypothetical protein
MLEPPVIAACVSGLVTLLLGVYVYTTQRRLGRERSLDEGRIRGIVDAHLKTHDARLKISVEWRLRMLTSMMESGSTLRVRINTAFGTVHKLAQHAAVNGWHDETRVLMADCDQANRDIGTAGGFLTPQMTDRALYFIGQFEDIVDTIFAWSHLESTEERRDACARTNESVKALGLQVKETFRQWCDAMWNQQELSAAPMMPQLASSGQP